MMERTYEGFFKNIFKSKKFKSISTEELKSEIENCFLDIADSNISIHVSCNLMTPVESDPYPYATVYIGRHAHITGENDKNNIIETLLFAIPYLKEFGLGLFKIEMTVGKFTNEQSILIDNKKYKYKNLCTKFMEDIKNFTTHPNIINEIRLVFNINIPIKEA